MPIRVLPAELVAKIAAGEVIERPASVAKELAENAIDAGGDEIHIEIAQGGRRLIRVRDNGCGMAADEVELAFARHATSKLSSTNDLYHLRTLGFRGEALASIAAVSHLTISTRTAPEELGTLLRLEGGIVSSREALARPPGTTVQVENLFFNMPARLKFLRRDRTEASHVARLVSSYALAYPERRLVLHHNDRLVLRTNGAGKVFDVLVSIYGLDVAEQMIEIDRSLEEGTRVQVRGYVGAPSLHRVNRQEVIFFVNRRWIQDNSLSYAVTEAYRSLLPVGRHPMVVLDILLPTEEVDVNIHPTKREVRFRYAREVFSAVQRAVRMTLMARHPMPRLATTREFGGLPGRRRTPGGTAHPASSQGRMALEAQRAGDALSVEQREGGSLNARRVTSERLPMLRVLGQIAQTYLIAEGPGGFYLIDQHAAHERVRYEELISQRGRMEVASQELLDPLSIELSPQQSILLEDSLDTLGSWGFEIIPFGGTTFLVKRVPADLVGGAVRTAILEIVDGALAGGEGFSWDDQTFITLSCHTAVRAGQTLTLEEMRELVRQLEKTALPHTCPHGRPTIIHFSQEQLEREFGRR